MQTSALRHHLGLSRTYVYEFIDGGNPSTPATGIEQFIAPDEALCYYDPNSAESILEAIDDLSAWVVENGPFDGVMGFSQGASLAAMVLARARHANPPPFGFAVLICAGLPYCEKSLRSGELKFLTTEDSLNPIIHVPTAHIFGSKDPDANFSKGMIDLCQTWGRVVMDHGSGHEIPRVPVDVTHDMASIIEKVVTKATLGQ